MDDLSTPQSSKQKPAIRLGVAILIGQIVVNLPVLIIILFFTFVGTTRTLTLVKTNPSIPELAIFLGVMGSILISAIAGWLWWSVSIKRWRIWALKNGAPEGRLQKWAALTGLVWPNSSIFERSE